MTKDEEDKMAKVLLDLCEVVKVQKEQISKHEKAIGLLLREVKALKEKEQKPKIWTP